MQLSRVVVLGTDEVARENHVHPARDVADRLLLARARHRVHQDRADDLVAAVEADQMVVDRGHVPGIALLVDLKMHIVEHHGRKMKPDMPLQILIEVRRRDVDHPLRQLGIVRIHPDRVHEDVARDTVFAVLPPLDDAVIAERRGLDRGSLVVDLRVAAHIVLADHPGEGPDLAVAELLRRRSVHERDRGRLLRRGDVRDGSLRHREDPAVGSRMKDRAAENERDHHR